MQEATVYVKGREVILYDTPGFDDSEGRDAEIFHALAGQLAKSYDMGIRINGVIFMQSVSDPRVPKSERCRSQLISKVVGAANYSHIAIATTMWDQIVPEFGKRNEANRADNVWKDMLNGGAEMLQYRNTKDSARDLLQQIVSNQERFSPFVLKLQDDLLQEQGHLGKTEAGIHLQAELGQKLGSIHRTIEISGETPELRAEEEKLMSWQRRLLETVVRALS